MRITHKSGMTLVELPFVIIFLIVGALVADWAARQIGWLGYPLGFLGGIIVSLGIVYALGARLLLVWPERPDCKSGTCKSDDYEIHRTGKNFDWICRCGVHYRKDGRRFYEVREGDSLVPFKIWKVFRGWSSDTH